MPNPFDKFDGHEPTAQPNDAATQASAGDAAFDQFDDQRGKYGSGGVEDQGQFGDPKDDDVPDGATDIQRDENGNLLGYRDATGKWTVAINGDATPYDVAGQSDSTGAALARGVGDSVTLGGANRIFAGIQGLDDALHGGSFTESYDATLKRLQDVMHADEAGHPVARTVGQIIGGLAIPVGLEGVGLRAGSSVLRAGGSIQEARAAAAVAVRNRMAAMGGAGGAAHGYLSSDDLGSADAAENAAIEGTLGAAGGMAFGAAGERLAPGMEAARVARRAQPLTDAQRAIAAADRQDIDLIPEDVGGPLVRRLSSAAVQAPLSATPIVNASQRMVQQSQAARDRVAQSIGEVLNPEAAGETAIQGARGYIARTSAQGGAMYRAAEDAAGNARVTPTRALETLDRNIAELGETPGGAEGLQRLQGLRDALSRGTFSVQGVRNMRTALRDEFANAGLRGSDIERRVNQVVDAANEDVVDSLNRQGRGEAARLYDQASEFWRNRLNTIDQHIEPIIGGTRPKSGEEVVAALQRAMTGNNQRFTAFLDTLGPQEEADVRASLIGRIGTSNAGAQNADGDAFSLSTFLTNWNKIGEGQKRRLFGPEGRAALNDLAIVADHARQAQQYANRSNTAGGLWGNIGALFGLGAISPNAAATSAIAQLAGGRLLASPRFARWLARAPRTRLSGAAYLDRLTRIARAEPAIANDVLQLQQRLEQALAGGGSAPLAAQDKKDGAAVPPQGGPNE